MCSLNFFKITQIYNRQTSKSWLLEQQSIINKQRMEDPVHAVMSKFVSLHTLFFIENCCANSRGDYFIEVTISLYVGNEVCWFKISG